MFYHNFNIFATISPLRRTRPGRYSIKLESIQPICCMPNLGLNWPSGYGEEDENVESL